MRRAATEIGFIPGGISIVVTGVAQGEYTPVRVDNSKLQPPFGTAPATIGAPTTAAPPAATVAAAASPVAATDSDPPILGDCRIGLHARADPTISAAESRNSRT